LDEFLQPVNDGSGSGRSRRDDLTVNQGDFSVANLFKELSNIAISGEKGKASQYLDSTEPMKVSKEVDRLLWETSSFLSDSRPPDDFCVYNSSAEMSDSDLVKQIPPIFDGSVANSTPPPLGGASAGASGGAGTILHLACAMDLPLMVAFFLVMGADGRSTHTNFRRLMIHEAACNGSISCLLLLLEMGREFAQESNNNGWRSTSSPPLIPDSLSLPSPNGLDSHLPDLEPSITPFGLNIHHFRRGSARSGVSKGDYLAVLCHFRGLSRLVQRGEMTELDAARALLKTVTLSETTRSALIRSCVFTGREDSVSSRTFLRPHGCADGHGNTPLHWAAFKDETKCVSLLLEFSANPNARAHPSGWTPLHDAAYSNSSNSIELLISNGANVDSRANSGATPLCFAAQEDSSEAARLLLKCGADLTARCAGSPHDDGTGVGPLQPHSRFSGYTPLHYCAHYNAHKASQVLLSHSTSKVAMETPDLSGRLPIHVAVARGSSDVLRELLHAGARIDIRPLGAGGNGGRPAASTANALVAFGGARLRQRPPSPEAPPSPVRNLARSRSTSLSPVTSPVLRSLIPDQPINSAKPWNCLSQQAIDECKDLICKAEQSWSPDRHLLFTPQDRKAVMELLRIGKRLEQQGVLFLDLWPLVLGFCGRGWFEYETVRVLDFAEIEEESGNDGTLRPRADEGFGSDNHLTLPSLSGEM